MASGNTVRIYINGDASGVSKAARDAERALGRMSGSASKSFRGMTEVAGGFGLAMGVGGVLGAVKDSVSAYQESEKAAARMSAQLDTLGQNTETVKRRIDDAIASQSKFGAFDDEDLQDSFTRLLRSTGDVNEALELNGLVMDIARGKGVDLATAAEAVAKAADGNVGALKRMGVQVDKGASAQEALAAAQSKFAGQAKAYGESSAAAGDRVKVAWGNVQEEIGQKLSGAFTRGAQGAETFAGSVNDVVDALGGFQNVAIAGGLFAGIRTVGPPLQDAGTAARGFATQLGKIKQNAGWGSAVKSAARTAGGALSNLAGGPMGLAAVGASGLAIGIGILAEEMTTLQEEADDAAAALKDVADAQLDAQGAAINVEQAEAAYDQSQRRRQSTLRDLRRESDQYATAVRKHGRGSQEAAQAQAQYNQALQTNKIATLDAVEAQHRLKVAKENQAEADQRLKVSADEYAKQLRGMRESAESDGSKAAAKMAATQQVVNFALQEGKMQAKAFADQVVASAGRNKEFTQSNRDTAAAVANVVRQMDHVPTEQEIQWISNTIATSGNIEDLKRKLGLVPAVTPANVSSNAGSVKDEVDNLKQSLYNLNGNVTTVYIDTVRRNKGPAGGGAATGAAIAGSFDGADNVPINVSRGEVVLNPRQIAMVGRDRVFGALRATGAPTIVPGGSFAGGGSNTMSGGPRATGTWRDQLDRASTRYSAAFNTLDARLAMAERTPSPKDDVSARDAIRRLIKRRLRDLSVWARMVPGRFRGDIYGEIASLTRTLSQYEESTTSGGGVDTADLEARLAQAEARAAGASRNLALSEAALGAFGGYGAGAGRTTVVQFHSIFPPTPDQYRSGAAFMSDAFGRQSYRRTARIRIGA